MAIGDALLAVWLERACISPQDFAINHPAGALGRQLTLTVADLIEPNGKRTISVLPVVDPADPWRLLGLLRLHGLVQAGPVAGRLPRRRPLRPRRSSSDRAADHPCRCAPGPALPGRLDPAPPQRRWGPAGIQRRIAGQSGLAGGV